MIAKASIEIAQTVNTARRARRPMYASMGARGHPPLTLPSPQWGEGCSKPLAPEGGEGRVRRSLVLVVERRRPRDARGLAVRTVVHARWDVAHVVLDDTHAHGGRALADHADDVDLLGGDPPDVLAELDPLLLRHAEGLLPLLHQLLHLRLGLLPLRAAGLEPLCIERPRGRDGVDLEGKHV